MKQYNSDCYKEQYVIYKQNPEPALPEILYYRESWKGKTLDVIWMGTCIEDATSFTNMDDLVHAYSHLVKTMNEDIGVMLISTILNTIPTNTFADKLHDSTVERILKKLDSNDIDYLKQTGVLK